MWKDRSCKLCGSRIQLSASAHRASVGKGHSPIAWLCGAFPVRRLAPIAIGQAVTTAATTGSPLQPFQPMPRSNLEQPPEALSLTPPQPPLPSRHSSGPDSTHSGPGVQPGPSRPAAGTD
ncbi:hypothetical protein N7519_000064 [Penicillium mononematosum]|uniref:uncharacterized protein n=1 Tax=Penicillium mononematosum TaxID=268346 RepID=UPI00254911E0|nr:uncharacterized protein N7519_000064 [Penicillium mononematosum]KAJ6190043.1 hypothetical protein N7519_000064 [Penicillium mononematosum]